MKTYPDLRHIDNISLWQIPVLRNVLLLVVLVLIDTVNLPPLREDVDLVVHGADEDAVAHPRHRHRRRTQTVGRAEADATDLHPAGQMGERKMFIRVKAKRAGGLQGDIPSLNPTPQHQPPVPMSAKW